MSSARPAYSTRRMLIAIPELGSEGEPKALRGLALDRLADFACRLSPAPQYGACLSRGNGVAEGCILRQLELNACFVE